MRVACKISRRGDGTWTLRHDSADVGSIEVVAATREEAVEKMRGEVRYRLELCPCTGDTYQHVEVEIAEE